MTRPPFPLISADDLRTKLEQIRQDGYALDEGEGHPSVCCIAAPVVDRSGAVEAAITSVAPCARFQQEKPALVAAILAVARAIESLRAATPAHDAGRDVIRQEPDAAIAACVAAAMAEIGEAVFRVD